MKEWGRYTLLNTIGQLLVESGSKYSGGGWETSFSIDAENSAVVLYDDDAEGNGEELINRYYMISRATRSANGEMRRHHFQAMILLKNSKRNF